MLTAVAILASLTFICWFIYRTGKGKPFKAHIFTYTVACVTGVFTLAFFLSMDIPQLIKIVVSIFLGIALIILAAYFQRRRQPDKS